MSTYTDASLIVTPNAVKSGKLYSLKGTDLDVVRATTATYVGADGLNQTALANVPRLDYTNGSCPSILVEPQRTNLFLQSNNFTQGWTAEGVSLSVNTNISPDGSLNASTLSETAFNDVHRTYRPAFGITTDVDYTFSFFVKKNTDRYIRLIINTSNNTSIWVAAQFDLDTLTFTNNVGTGGGVFKNASITQFDNGWLRVSLTGSITGFLCYAVLALSNGNSILSTDIRGCNVYFGDTNNKLDYYGGQFELGSNATSYIPTTTKTVTRNAEVISKSGLTGITTITETFENGTTNAITGSPTSYTMSQGRIKNVIGL